MLTASRRVRFLWNLGCAIFGVANAGILERWRISERIVRMGVESGLLWCLNVFQFRGGFDVHSKPRKFMLLPKVQGTAEIEL